MGGEIVMWFSHMLLSLSPSPPVCAYVPVSDISDMSMAKICLRFLTL